MSKIENQAEQQGCCEINSAHGASPRWGDAKLTLRKIDDNLARAIVYVPDLQI